MLPVKIEQFVALCDSAAEICLIRTDLFKKLGIPLNPQGSVKIRGIIGKPVEAQLALIRLSLSPEQPDISVLCAVSDAFNEPFVIPSLVVSQLIDAGNDQMVDFLAERKVTAAILVTLSVQSVPNLKPSRPRQRLTR